MKLISLALVRLDGGTQSRAELNRPHVARLVEAIEAGDELDPIDAYYDGEVYWPSDGFHRCTALRQAGATEVRANVKQGTRDDAVWASLGANKEHDKAGLGRSIADKRRAVEAALRHPNGARLSDGKIAEWCGVSRPFVGSVRAEAATRNGYELTTVRLGADGKTRDVVNIGKSRPKAPHLTDVSAPAPPKGDATPSPLPTKRWAGDLPVISASRTSTAPPMASPDPEEEDDEPVGFDPHIELGEIRRFMFERIDRWQGPRDALLLAVKEFVCVLETQVSKELKTNVR